MQTLQNRWQAVLPILKSQTLNALRGLRRALIWSIDRLSHDSAKWSVDSPKSKTSPLQSDAFQSEPAKQQSWQEKAQKTWNTVQPVIKAQLLRILRVSNEATDWAMQRLEPSSNDNQAAPSASSSSQTAVVLDRFVATIQRIWAWWSAKLETVRDRLPESWRSLLPPPVITGVLIVALLLLLSSISSPSPAQTPSVQPSLNPEPTAAVPAPDTVPSSKDAVDVNQPNISDVPLERTPEQSLISAIQDQVTEITSQYANGLIQSVQANFRSSRLTVNLGEGWYALSPSAQDHLATEMLDRATNLQFEALELLDSQGELLGRSPVVGSTMIILKRDQTNVKTESVS
jgi:hypothetical protein